MNFFDPIDDMENEDSMFPLSHTYSNRLNDMGVLEYLDDIVDGRVLDLGCSYGFTTEELDRRYPSEIIGLDAYRREDQKDKNPDIIVGLAPNTPFKSESFDTVVAANSIGVVGQDFIMGDNKAREFRSEVLNDIREILTPGGHFVIINDGSFDQVEYLELQKNEDDWDINRMPEGSDRRMEEWINETQIDEPYI